MSELLVPAVASSVLVALFVVFASLVHRERTLGRRVLLGAFRARLDVAVQSAGRIKLALRTHVRKWVQSVAKTRRAPGHSITRRPGLGSVPTNTSSLADVRAHRRQTALTPAERAERKRRSVEEWS
jgi:hypothetical protein